MVRENSKIILEISEYNDKPNTEDGIQMQYVRKIENSKEIIKSKNSVDINEYVKKIKYLNTSI